MRLPESLSVLRHRTFATFFAGRAVSMLGSAMAPIALAFAVLDLSDSATDLGYVLAARSIPMVILLLVGGVVADRLPRNLVLRTTHLFAAVTQGVAAALLLTGTAQVWSLVVVEAANGAVVAFTFPALQGVIPQVTPSGRLQQANALMGIVRNSTAIIGPPVASLLVVTVGPGWAIAVDAFSYLVAAYAMSRLSIAQVARTAATGMLRELRDGWSEFVSRTWVWVIVAVFGILNALLAAAWLTLGPVVAQDTIGRGPWGVVQGGEAAGLLVATVVLLRLSLRYPLRAGMIGITLDAAPMLLLGLSPQAVALVALAFVAGMGTEVFSIGWSTALQEHVPNEVLSRVSSYDALGSFVAIPVGQLLAGPLSAVFGIRNFIVAAALATAVLALATLLVPSVRNLPRSAGGSPEQVGAPVAEPSG